MKYSILFFWAIMLVAPNVFSQNANVVFRKKLTFPSETLANVCGYTANGHEYALVGGAKGMYIIDVTDPDNPVQISQIPGPNNLWKEIKTYKNYAYVVSEGGFGLQIIDLSTLPTPPVNYYSYVGDGAIENTLNKAHALHIDETKGYVYLFGSNLAGGAPIVCSLEPDPYHPVYVGRFDQYGYVHDGYADNDTLYACHIYNGYFSMVDMTNKTSPQSLAIQNTPNTFPHNAWLTKDRKTILTTDEVPNSFLAAYDITDPSNIRLLDKIQSNPGTNSMVHNTHVRDNWAITSWYTDGITIVDVTRPHNLIQVGNYDTYSVTSGGSNGCWGVYPFFPSGTLIASNIKAPGSSNGELYILTPTYIRACYLEGKVTDGVNGSNLNGVKVEFIDVNPAVSELTTTNGRYATGLAVPGTYTIRYSKTGYQTLDILAPMIPGEVTEMNVQLFPNGTVTIQGKVTEASTGNPVGQAEVQLIGTGNTWSALSDNDGNYTITGVPPGTYAVHASKPFVGTSDLLQQSITGNATINIPLKKNNRN